MTTVYSIQIPNPPADLPGRLQLHAAMRGISRGRYALLAIEEMMQRDAASPREPVRKE